MEGKHSAQQPAPPGQVFCRVTQRASADPWSLSRTAAVLAGHLRDIVMDLQQPRLAIAPLQAAVAKVAGDRPLITPMHAMLFQW